MTTKLAKRGEMLGSGPVRYKVLGTPESPGGTLLAIDYTDAAVPKHFYVTDYFEVHDRDPDVIMVFGKRDGATGTQLRNKIEIYFPAFTFINQFWNSSRDFQRGLEKYVDNYKYEPVEPGTNGTTEKVQTLYSNNALMVLASPEALIDFFYLSARDIVLRARKQQSVDLEGVVRVITPPNLLLGLMRALEPIANRLGPKYFVEAPSESLESD